MHDVVVVGSGAGGGTIAAALARGGMRVLVLEKGPWYSERDFLHDEIAIVRRDFFVPSPSDEPHVLDGKRTDFGWIACCVGGGTVHMAGHYYRLHPDDFRMASKFGRRYELADWPFAYADLEPYYTRAEWESGVSGLAGSHPFEGPRSKPYPLPPIRTHPIGTWIDDAGRRLGLHPFPEARAILSQPYRGRSACVYCDFCGSYGCEVGAKSSTHAALLPSAVASGRCEIRPRAMVREVEVTPDGRARGCLYVDEDGRTHRVEGKVVILACSAIETARLLLLSRSKRFPQGLANGNGLVGRHLQFSAFSRGEGVFAPDRPEWKARDPFLGRSIADYYFLPEGVGEIPKGGTLRFGFPHANPVYTALRLAHERTPLRWGRALQERMKEYWIRTRTIEFEVFADFLPNRETFVELDPEVKDRWGLPAARIHLSTPPHHEKAGKYLVEKGLEVLKAAGALEARATVVGGVTGHLVHGTCRTGTDPATSVLDPECRAHEVPNLYVVDGSFLPTSGGVPTTLTIMANALRVAERILP